MSTCDFTQFWFTQGSIQAKEMQCEVGWTSNMKTDAKYWMELFQILCTHASFKDSS